MYTPYKKKIHISIYITGFIAGPQTGSGVGGGSDLLCLPRTPGSSARNSGLSQGSSNTYISPVRFDKTQSTLRNALIGCATCLLEARSTTVSPTQWIFLDKIQR